MLRAMNAAKEGDGRPMSTTSFEALACSLDGDPLARRRFLEAGHYRPIAEAVSRDCV